MQRIMSTKFVCGALALAALAGAATTASADDCCRWELRVKRTAVLSDNFEVELWAHFPDDKFAFAGGRVDILSDDIEWISHDLCGIPSGPGSSSGVPSATGDIMSIIVGQLHFPVGGVIAQSDNPIRVWCGEFEAKGTGYRTLTTDTDNFTYYVSASSVVQESCRTVREAYRTAFVGPIVIDEWIASAFLGTIGTPRRGGLLLEADSTAPRTIGAALAAEDARWAPGARFEHAIDLADLSDMDRLTMAWYPRWRCAPWDIGWLDLVLEEVAVPGVPPVVELTPDFSRIGVPRVPARMLLGGRTVGEPTLGSGAAMRLFNPCTSLTWSYVLNDLDQLVLVLKCDSPFDVEAGGQRYTVDTIELDPMQGPGAVEGMDRVEISGMGARQMTIVDAGFVGASACRADCDGDGGLTLFDFLCYQNLFDAGDLAADFDGDGRLTIFDFLAFQNEFSAGCR